MYRVTRSFKFDSGHRLFGYEGKCKHIHGHSYVAEVTVGGFELDHLGMLVDFGVLKKLQEWIDKWWDHNLLLCDSDPLWKVMPEANGGRLPYNTRGSLPTAEVMCELLCREASALLDSERIRVVKVRIYETEDCWAEYFV